MPYSDKPTSSSGSISPRTMLVIALLVALELAMSALESLIPPFLPLPGIKLGLANIITLISFSLLSKRQVFIVVAMRLALAGFVLATFLTPSFLISVGGGLLSFLIMSLLWGRKPFSVVGVSLAGAASHNLGQLAAVYLLMSNSAILFYLPLLLTMSVPMGFFTGYAAKAALAALKATGVVHRLT